MKCVMIANHFEQHHSIYEHFNHISTDITAYEYERQEPAPRHGPGPLVPVFPALCAGRVPVRP